MSFKKTRSSRNSRKQIEQLEILLEQNSQAVSTPPSKKRWTKHDIKQFQPLTENMKLMYRYFLEGGNLVCIGSAGTGKTFNALYLAVRELIEGKNGFEKIRIVRSTVPSREMGFLPGTEEEKLSPYETPYRDILHTICGRASTYDDMKKAGLIEFVSTSFIRGTTWDNTIVVLDEGQNMTWHELNSVATRVGDNTKLIITGDTRQCDFTSKYETTGLPALVNVAKRMDCFDIIEFTVDDIIRSGFVKEWIMACESEGL